MKKTTKLIIVIIIAILLISALFVIAYYSNHSESLELCKPGDKIGYNMGGQFCYTPSGFQGKSCDKSTDCGTAAGCVFITEFLREHFTDSSKIKLAGSKGYCKDLPYGCYVWIDKDGNYNEKEDLCVD